jgi:uncharacterized protein YdeI (YjbR/CyaY-like superfamily)
MKPDAADVIFEFENANAWRDWLHKSHAKSPGVWVRLAKKGAEAKSVSHAEALEVALCYGWIDAQKRGESAHAWLQRFMPRAKKSIWSKINRQKALELIKAGRMQPAGIEEVERAQADGRWVSAYDSPRGAAPPPEFQAALDKNKRAKAFYAKLDSANRYAFLFRIQTAKKPETRARRIEQFIAMLERGEKLHP